MGEGYLGLVILVRSLLVLLLFFLNFCKGNFLCLYSYVRLCSYGINGRGREKTRRKGMVTWTVEKGLSGIVLGVLGLAVTIVLRPRVPTRPIISVSFAFH